MGIHILSDTSLIPSTNADSNVESAVGTYLQSGLDKDVSIVGCYKSVYISNDKSAGVCCFFPHNTTVGGIIRKNGVITT